MLVLFILQHGLHTSKASCKQHAATITAELKALTHTLKLWKATLWHLYQCTITSSASVTSENHQQDLQSNGSPSLRFSSALPAEHFSPCPFALSLCTRCFQPPDRREGLKGSLGFYFCSLCGLLLITVPSQQEWPCGSNTLTTHKQRQGPQMTTCHCPGALICG